MSLQIIGFNVLTHTHAYSTLVNGDESEHVYLAMEFNYSANETISIRTTGSTDVVNWSDVIIENAKYVQFANEEEMPESFQS